MLLCVWSLVYNLSDLSTPTRNMKVPARIPCIVIEIRQTLQLTGNSTFFRLWPYTKHATLIIINVIFSVWKYFPFLFSNCMIFFTLLCTVSKDSYETAIFRPLKCFCSWQVTVSDGLVNERSNWPIYLAIHQLLLVKPIAIQPSVFNYTCM